MSSILDAKQKQALASRKSYLKRKAVVKARAREWNAKQRMILGALVVQAKEAGCTDCGGHFHLSAMEFDHVRGAKRGDIASMWSGGRVSVKTLQDEMAKCEVVCANCHRIRTDDRKQAAATSGR